MAPTTCLPTSNARPRRLKRYALGAWSLSAFIGRSWGTEELHLVVETRSDDLPEDQQADELRRVITATVSQHTGVAPTRVHLVPRKGIPKTTSGKPRRFQVRQRVETTLTAASSRRYP